MNHTYRNSKPFIGTLWLFNIAMENGPFIDDFPIEPSIYKGFSMAMLNNQMVVIQGFVNVPIVGDFGHRLQIFVEDYIPNSEFGHLPAPVI